MRKLLTITLLSLPLGLGCASTATPGLVRAQAPEPSTLTAGSATAGTGLQAGTKGTTPAATTPTATKSSPPAVLIVSKGDDGEAIVLTGHHQDACDEAACEPGSSAHHCPHGSGCPLHGLGGGHGFGSGGPHACPLPGLGHLLPGHHGGWHDGDPSRNRSLGLNKNGPPVGDWYPTHYHTFSQHQRDDYVYPNSGVPSGVVQYPYYPVRGPSDFFMK